MPDITMVLGAEDAGHVRAWLNARQSIESYTSTLGKVDTQQKVNNASAKEFDALQTQAEKRAKQVIESLLTPQQKYHKSLEELNSLYSRNLLTQDQYLVKLKAEKAAFESLDPERQKAIQQQQAMAAAIAKTTEQTRTPMERYKQQVKELNEQLANGLGQDAYNRKLRQYREELVRTSGRLDERKQKEREVKDELEKAAAAAKKAETAQAAAQESALGKLGSTVAAITGIGSAIGGVMLIANQLKREYEDLKSRQAEAANTQITLAEAQRGAVFNLGSDESLSPEQMTAEIKKISGETGVGETTATRTFSDMLSSRGSMKARDVLPQLRDLLTAAPDQAGLPVMGGAMMSLGTEFGLSGKQSLGFMLQAQAASPVASIQSLAMNSVPSIVAVSKFGDNPEQSSELVAGLASAGKDVRGAESGTAAIQLAARLQKIIPDAKSTAERIERARGSKSLQDEIFKDEFGEAQYKPIFRELLKGAADSPTVTAYRSAQESITSPEAAAPTLSKLLENYSSLPTAQTAEAGRRFKTLQESLQIGDTFGGRSAVSREGLEGVLRSANIPKIVRDNALAGFDAQTQLGGADPLTAATSRLRSEANRLSTPIEDYSLSYGEFGGSSTSYVPSKSDLASAEAIRSLVEQLEALSKTIQENSRKTEENTKGANTLPNVAPPGPRQSSGRAQPKAQVP